MSLKSFTYETIKKLHNQLHSTPTPEKPSMIEQDLYAAVLEIRTQLHTLANSINNMCMRDDHLADGLMELQERFRLLEIGLNQLHK